MDLRDGLKRRLFADEEFQFLVEFPEARVRGYVGTGVVVALSDFRLLMVVDRADWYIQHPQSEVAETSVLMEFSRLTQVGMSYRTDSRICVFFKSDGAVKGETITFAADFKQEAEDLLLILEEAMRTL